ncbi:MAG: hypothetical protein HOV81_12695 [Kofleriaceae bacterium]|nr:hypothetical protein [Kofleriaceae bacterium]
MFRDALLAVVIAMLAGCAHDKPASVPSNHASTVTPHEPRSWRVYDGDVEILEVSDQPGPLVSTAPLPPDATPAMHPFLSATALEASHEDRLRGILERSHDVDEFVRLLQAEGFRVVAQ